MTRRAHPLHRLIIDEEETSGGGVSDASLDDLSALCLQLEGIRDRLGELTASRSTAYLDMTIQALKREKTAGPGKS